ncbi:MAG TPA: antirestriction protein [Povalibacter sp.]|uniref:antirestriction protein n=1 Tax=Povalibacter sp. TaxID=1962978 RepID=UPI002B78E7B4|nr:antirestriction protein [Povalibacter sp.]HMN44682.1 antirestriction protein [Povalibacter sp.]
MNLSQTIEAYPVPQSARLATLPAHFGQKMQIVEDRIYDFMRRFAHSYQGGWWQFYQLSNGGFYMSPPRGMYELRVDSNGFGGHMSEDAAGITVCLFTFSHLSFEFPDETFAQHFHWLRDFAMNHAEVSTIFAAID